MLRHITILESLSRILVNWMLPLRVLRRHSLLNRTLLRHITILVAALEGIGQLDEALASYNRAIVLKPDLNFILGDLLHTKMHLCIWDDLPNQLNELTKKINNSEKVISPFELLALIDDPEIQRKSC